MKITLEQLEARKLLEEAKDEVRKAESHLRVSLYLAVGAFLLLVLGITVGYLNRTVRVTPPYVSARYPAPDNLIDIVITSAYHSTTTQREEV